MGSKKVKHLKSNTCRVIKQTSTSLYSPNRYKEMTFDEIRNLLNKSEE